MERAEALWGWNPRLEIPSAVARLDRRWLDQRYVLITGVDSSFDVTQLVDLGPLLEDLNAESVVRGEGIVIEGAIFAEILSIHEYFDGFDEVWLFDEIPVDPKPDATRLTTDVKLLQAPETVLTNWLQENNGVAGLGDGDGLNWISARPSLADLWNRE